MNSEATVKIMRATAYSILAFRDEESSNAVELAEKFLALDAAIQASSDNIPRSWVPF